MTMMDRAEMIATTKLLTAARKAFPHTTVDGETIALYVRELSDLSFIEVQAAIAKLIKSSNFFPTIAEIRRAAASIVERATGKEKPTAGEAWGEAMKYAKARGPYDSRPYEFSCDEVKAALDRIGRQSLWNMETKDEGIYRAQFMRIYTEELARQKEHKEIDDTLKKLGVAGDVRALMNETVKRIGAA